MYESFDTLCIYLESDALASPERNFWVKYRIAVVNQRHPDRTEWKDSAICTKTWNNSVLQFMKVAPPPLACCRLLSLHDYTGFHAHICVHAIVHVMCHHCLFGECLLDLPQVASDTSSLHLHILLLLLYIMYAHLLLLQSTYVTLLNSSTLQTSGQDLHMDSVMLFWCSGV